MPATLLLADDSVTIQRVIELTFADEDVQVVAVSDGDQAIARLEASPPDIVLADIGMPGKSGYEVAQYIRQSPRLAHIPVMLLAGAFEPVDQERAAAAGCDGVLAKPFEPQLVIARVKELLARKRPVHGAVAAEAPPAPQALDNQWAPPPPPEPPAAASPSAPEPIALDDYFDRLDAAFSNLSQPSAAPPHSAPAAAVPEIDWFAMTALGAPEPQPAEPPAPAAQAEPPAVPLTYASPPPEAPAPLFEPAIEPPAPQAEPAPLAAFDPGPDYAPFEPEPEPEHAAAAPAAAIVAPFPPDRRWPPPASEPAPASREVAAPAAPAPPPAAAAAHPAELPALADAFAALLAAEQGEPLPPAAPAWPATPPRDTASDAFVEDVVRRVLERLSDQVVRDTVGGIVSKVAEQLVRDEIEKIKAALK